MSNDTGGLSLSCLCFLKCSADRVKIMSVDVDYMEVERLELLIDRIRRTYLVNRSVDLKTVVVHDDYEVVKLSVACKHSSLPNLTFLNLTVSKECIHTIVLALELSAECHSDCCGNALTEGAGGHIYAGNVNAGMSL